MCCSVLSQSQKQLASCAAGRYESLEDDDEGEDGAMDTVAAALREAARNSATNQVLQESAQVRTRSRPQQ